MKYFAMTDLLNDDMLKRFIDFYNNGHDEVTIVLNTNGGSSWVTVTLIDMINSLPNASIIIYAAYSSGLELALHTNCRKVLAENCRGMWHYGKREMWINDKNKPTYFEDECILKGLPNAREKSEKIAK